MSNLSEAWVLVKAAGSLNNQLVPADVPPFIHFYKLYPHRFREAVVVAFVKEPGPIEIFIRHLRGVESAEQPLEHVRQAWRATVGEVVRLVQDLNAVQQLSRQGTCRFSCLARSMSIIGIIEASSSNVAGENCFPLGVPQTYTNTVTILKSLLNFITTSRPPMKNGRLCRRRRSSTSISSADT